MKLPSFQFYPGDWRKDPNLSRASLKAKGALIDILCLAFECEKRGILKTGSHSWSIKEVARAIGGDLKENTEAINELLSLSILKKDKKGAMYSARMVEDEKRRIQNKKDGHLGGNPKLTHEYNKPGHLYAVRRKSDRAIKIGIALNVRNRLYKLRYQHKEDSLELVKEWAVEDMGRCEKLAHEMFENKKIIGEWFNINELELQEIDSTLMGEGKGKQRASSSSSSSSSSIVNNSLILEKEKLTKLMRQCANFKYTTNYLDQQADAFKVKYTNVKIDNLAALVKSWMNQLPKEAVCI